MRILVCGSREWRDRDKMEKVLLDIFNVGDTLIYGCCRGADNMAYEILTKEFRDAYGDLEINILPFPANWKEYGISAGPIRNKEMLVIGKPDLVLAFTKSISQSRGTTNMIILANQYNVEVRLYGERK